MSGLEILGAVASSIALVQAVKGTLKAVDFLRQNSEMKKECNSLRREMLMIECFIVQAQQQTDPTMLSQRLLGPAGHPLVSLAVEELEEILNELNEIVEKYSHSRKVHDPKRYTDKMKWFSEVSKIKELRGRAQGIKSELHMAITFRISSMVDRGNMRQEVLFHRVTQQLTYFTHESQETNQSLPSILGTSAATLKESKMAQQLCDQEPEERSVVLSSSTTTSKIEVQNMPLTALTRTEERFMSVKTTRSVYSRTCSPTCQCHCHRDRQERNAGAWAKSILGSWLVKYEFSRGKCQGKCGSSTGIKLEYQLPKWLWAGVLLFEICQDPSLSLSLRPSRAIEPGHEIYGLLNHPLALQEHLQEGYRYFPSDTDVTGRCLLEPPLTTENWEVVEILLKLWANILPDQGLPRSAGYTLMSTLENLDQARDGSSRIDRVLSFIPDWDEICTSEVHQAALDTEVTREEMLKALQDQPWAIDKWDETGYAPIHYAASMGNVEILDLLIMANADINQRTYHGITPLMMSSRCRSDELTKRLLESEECRRHINDTISAGLNALHFAISHICPTSVRVLLEAGATVKTHSFPIMHYFSRYTKGDQDQVDQIFHLLLTYGADLEERNSMGMTPIMSAIMYRNLAALRNLVSADVSLSALDIEDYNILHWAAYRADAVIIDFLAKQDLVGVEIEERNNTGYSPLGMLFLSQNRPIWLSTETYPQPTSIDMNAFITFYFDLLIPDLKRHKSTIDELLHAVEEKDGSMATEILDELIEKKARCRQIDLTGWYRGLKGYMIDGGWDNLEGALKEERNETNERIGRATIARGKTITDPEIEEFF
ncbi:hypothetical protein FLONG3_5311 [Fusarium longipes]|uniref:Uncharacterized protein n=1 Tax=Fusarium longipes TaxID=694270 RepID=A0A395SW13_9HYPO|nr:hypothetical protein FLONG3_5311 [Fusarium longipes]